MFYFKSKINTPKKKALIFSLVVVLVLAFAFLITKANQVEVAPLGLSDAGDIVSFEEKGSLKEGNLVLVLGFSEEVAKVKMTPPADPATEKAETLEKKVESNPVEELPQLDEEFELDDSQPQTPEEIELLDPENTQDDDNINQTILQAFSGDKPVAPKAFGAKANLGESGNTLTLGESGTEAEQANKLEFPAPTPGLYLFEFFDKNNKPLGFKGYMVYEAGLNQDALAIETLSKRPPNWRFGDTIKIDYTKDHSRVEIVEVIYPPKFYFPSNIPLTGNGYTAVVSDVVIPEEYYAEPEAKPMIDFYKNQKVCKKITYTFNKDYQDNTKIDYLFNGSGMGWDQSNELGRMMIYAGTGVDKIPYKIIAKAYVQSDKTLIAQHVLEGSTKVPSATGETDKDYAADPVDIKDQPEKYGMLTQGVVSNPTGYGPLDFRYLTPGVTSRAGFGAMGDTWLMNTQGGGGSPIVQIGGGRYPIHELKYYQPKFPDDSVIQLVSMNNKVSIPGTTLDYYTFDIIDENHHGKGNMARSYSTAEYNNGAGYSFRFVKDQTYMKSGQEITFPPLYASYIYKGVKVGPYQITKESTIKLPNYLEKFLTKYEATRLNAGTPNNNYRLQGEPDELLFRINNAKVDDPNDASNQRWFLSPVYENLDYTLDFPYEIQPKSFTANIAATDKLSKVLFYVDGDPTPRTATITTVGITNTVSFDNVAANEHVTKVVAKFDYMAPLSNTNFVYKVQNATHEGPNGSGALLPLSKSVTIKTTLTGDRVEGKNHPDGPTVIPHNQQADVSYLLVRYEKEDSLYFGRDYYTDRDSTYYIVGMDGSSSIPKPSAPHFTFRSTTYKMKDYENVELFIKPKTDADKGTMSLFNGFYLPSGVVIPAGMSDKMEVYVKTNKTDLEPNEADKWKLIDSLSNTKTSVFFNLPPGEYALEAKISFGTLHGDKVVSYVHDASQDNPSNQTIKINNKDFQVGFYLKTPESRTFFPGTPEETPITNDIRHGLAVTLRSDSEGQHFQGNVPGRGFFIGQADTYITHKTYGEIWFNRNANGGVQSYTPALNIGETASLYFNDANYGARDQVINGKTFYFNQQILFEVPNYVEVLGINGTVNWKLKEAHVLSYGKTGSTLYVFNQTTTDFANWGSPSAFNLSIRIREDAPPGPNVPIVKNYAYALTDFRKENMQPGYMDIPPYYRISIGGGASNFPAHWVPFYDFTQYSDIIQYNRNASLKVILNLNSSDGAQHSSIVALKKTNNFYSHQKTELETEAIVGATSKLNQLSLKYFIPRKGDVTPTVELGSNTSDFDLRLKEPIDPSHYPELQSRNLKIEYFEDKAGTIPVDVVSDPSVANLTKVRYVVVSYDGMEANTADTFRIPLATDHIKKDGMFTDISAYVGLESSRNGSSFVREKSSQFTYKSYNITLNVGADTEDSGVLKAKFNTALVKVTPYYENSSGQLVTMPAVENDNTGQIKIVVNDDIKKFVVEPIDPAKNVYYRLAAPNAATIAEAEDSDFIPDAVNKAKGEVDVVLADLYAGKLNMYDAAFTYIPKVKSHDINMSTEATLVTDATNSPLAYILDDLTKPLQAIKKYNAEFIYIDPTDATLVEDITLIRDAVTGTMKLSIQSGEEPAEIEYKIKITSTVDNTLIYESNVAKIKIKARPVPVNSIMKALETDSELIDPADTFTLTFTDSDGVVQTISGIKTSYYALPNTLNLIPGMVYKVKEVAKPGYDPISLSMVWQGTDSGGTAVETKVDLDLTSGEATFTMPIIYSYMNFKDAILTNKNSSANLTIEKVFDGTATLPGETFQVIIKNKSDGSVVLDDTLAIGDTKTVNLVHGKKYTIQEVIGHNDEYSFLDRYEMKETGGAVTAPTIGTANTAEFTFSTNFSNGTLKIINKPKMADLTKISKLISYSDGALNNSATALGKLPLEDMKFKLSRVKTDAAERNVEFWGIVKKADFQHDATKKGMLGAITWYDNAGLTGTPIDTTVGANAIPTGNYILEEITNTNTYYNFVSFTDNTGGANLPMTNNGGAGNPTANLNPSTTSVVTVSNSLKKNGAVTITKSFKSNIFHKDDTFKFEITHKQSGEKYFAEAVHDGSTGTYTVTSWKDSNGVAVTGLHLGEYELKENLSGVTNYEFSKIVEGLNTSATNAYTFELTPAKESIQMGVENKIKEKAITFKKAYNYSGLTPEAFNFTLTRSQDGKVYTGKIDAEASTATTAKTVDIVWFDGVTPVSLASLPYGDYTLTEAANTNFEYDRVNSSLTGSTGVVAAGGITFTLSETSQATTNVLVANKVKENGTINLLKTISDNGAEGEFNFTLQHVASGAEFKTKITVTADGTISTFTDWTETSGTRKNGQLPLGSYNITEVDSKGSYRLDTFEINGVEFASTFTLSSDTPVALEAKNIINDGAGFALNKKLNRYGINAVDFTFTLEKENGATYYGIAKKAKFTNTGTETVKVEWYDNNNYTGTAVDFETSLTPGKYTLKEIVPATNFKFDKFEVTNNAGLNTTNNNLVFTVAANSTDFMEVTAFNSVKTTGQITVDKVFAGFHNIAETGGFTFTLTHDNGEKYVGTTGPHTNEATHSVTSWKKNGTAVTGLPFGHYTITESTGLTNYVFDKFTIGAATITDFVLDENVHAAGLVVNAQNKLKADGEVVVTKKLDSKVLKGETFNFTLTRNDATPVVYTGEAVIGNSGNSRQATVIWKDSNGVVVTLNDLPYGNYTLEELATAATSNYEFSDYMVNGTKVTNPVHTFDIQNNTKIEITANNKLANKGSVEISKALDYKDTTGNFKFTLTHESGAKYQRIYAHTNKALPIQFNDWFLLDGSGNPISPAVTTLPLGEYTLAEDAGDNHNLVSIKNNGTDITGNPVIVLDASTSKESANIDILNNVKKGKGPDVAKILNPASLNLDDFTFTLTRENDGTLVYYGKVKASEFTKNNTEQEVNVTWYSDAAHTTAVAGGITAIPYGEYTLKEDPIAATSLFEFEKFSKDGTDVTSGANFADSVAVTVDKTGVFNEIKTYNKVKRAGEVELQKTLKGTDRGYAEAFNFTLTHLATAEEYTATISIDTAGNITIPFSGWKDSGGSNKNTSLPYGQYKITEVPAQYYNLVGFSVDGGAQIPAVTDAKFILEDTKVSVVAENKLSTGSGLTLWKEAVPYGVQVEDFTFKLQNTTGDVYYGTASGNQFSDANPKVQVVWRDGGGSLAGNAGELDKIPLGNYTLTETTPTALTNNFEFGSFKDLAGGSAITAISGNQVTFTVKGPAGSGNESPHVNLEAVNNLQNGGSIKVNKTFTDHFNVADNFKFTLTHESGRIFQSEIKHTGSAATATVNSWVEVIGGTPQANPISSLPRGKFILKEQASAEYDFVQFDNASTNVTINGDEAEILLDAQTSLNATIGAENKIKNASGLVLEKFINIKDLTSFAVDPGEFEFELDRTTAAGETPVKYYALVNNFADVAGEVKGTVAWFEDAAHTTAANPSSLTAGEYTLKLTSKTSPDVQFKSYTANRGGASIADVTIDNTNKTLKFKVNSQTPATLNVRAVSEPAKSGKVELSKIFDYTGIPTGDFTFTIKHLASDTVYVATGSYTGSTIGSQTIVINNWKDSANAVVNGKLPTGKYTIVEGANPYYELDTISLTEETIGGQQVPVFVLEQGAGTEAKVEITATNKLRKGEIELNKNLTRSLGNLGSATFDFSLYRWDGTTGVLVPDIGGPGVDSVSITLNSTDNLVTGKTIKLDGEYDYGLYYIVENTHPDFSLVETSNVIDQATAFSATNAVEVSTGLTKFQATNRINGAETAFVGYKKAEGTDNINAIDTFTYKFYEEKNGVKTLWFTGSVGSKDTGINNGAMITWQKDPLAVTNASVDNNTAIINLPKGTYLVEEDSTGDNFTAVSVAGSNFGTAPNSAVGQNAYRFDVNNNLPSDRDFSVLFTNKLRNDGVIEVTKVFENNLNTFGGTQFEFVLVPDHAPTVKFVGTTDGTAPVAEWTNKATGEKFAYNAVPYGKYTLSETASKNYNFNNFTLGAGNTANAVVTGNSAKIVIEGSAANNAKIVAENAVKTNGNIVIEKKFNNQNPFATSNVIVNIYGPKINGVMPVLPTSTVTLDDTNGWKASLPNLVYGEYKIAENLSGNNVFEFVSISNGIETITSTDGTVKDINVTLGEELQQLKNSNITVTNHVAEKGVLVIGKEIEGPLNTMPEEEFVFVVTDAIGKEHQVAVTAGNKVKLENLPMGNVIVKEVDKGLTFKGYSVNGAARDLSSAVTVMLSVPNQEETVISYSEIQYDASIKITAHLDDTKKAVRNEVFEYELMMSFDGGKNWKSSDKYGIPSNVKLNTNESHTFDNLPRGANYKVTAKINPKQKYTVDEILLQNGTVGQVSLDEKSFTTRLIDNNIHSDIVFVARIKRINLVIDAHDKIVLSLKVPSVLLKLEKMNGDVVDPSFTPITLTTDDQGYCVFPRIEEGDYMVSQLSVPKEFLMFQRETSMSIKNNDTSGVLEIKLNASPDNFLVEPNVLHVIHGIKTTDNDNDRGGSNVVDGGKLQNEGNVTGNNTNSSIPKTGGSDFNGLGISKLPKTGGVPLTYLSLLGTVITVIGFILKRKGKKNSEI